MNRFQLFTAFAITVVSTVAQISQATENPPSIENNQIALVLSASNHLKSVRYTVQYPGLPSGRGDENTGVKFIADCLVVQNSGGVNQQAVDRILNQIAVANGINALTNRKLDRDMPMPRSQRNGKTIYLLTDLAKYLTGLEIRAKNSQKTFGQIVRETIGTNAPDIRLTFSRGCAAARPS